MQICCRKCIHNQSSHLIRSGFTMIELVVVTAIIAILISLALPAIQQVRSAARRTHCRNNLKNVSLAILQEMELKGRFPASGNYGFDATKNRRFNAYSWVLSVLPHLEQSALATSWNKDKSMKDPVNAPLARTFIPVLTCPDDISVAQQGDLSYVVNGGIGFTVKYSNGVGDCPVDRTWARLDLNGDGIVCEPAETAELKPTDRDMFLHFGVFFLETLNRDLSRRSHHPGSILDGMTHTYLVSENVRAGFDPDNPADGHWATSNPYRHSFYIGNPCANHDCTQGDVDYSRSNSGADAINSGLSSAEGSSPLPNSFHSGGVNMAFCDGRVVFLSQRIDGGVYAAQASPQGSRLDGTRFAQPLITE
ncbi:MAG: DUF1559 domain-containing protein [Planctomycetota bacterium]